MTQQFHSYVYPREIKTYGHTKMYTQMFIIAKKWKPKCPSTSKWINKLQYIHTMEYSLAI